MPNLPQNEPHNPPLIKLANLQSAIELNGKSKLALPLPPLHAIVNPLRSIPHSVHHQP